MNFPKLYRLMTLICKILHFSTHATNTNITSTINIDTLAMNHRSSWIFFFNGFFPWICFPLGVFLDFFRRFFSNKNPVTKYNSCYLRRQDCRFWYSRYVFYERLRYHPLLYRKRNILQHIEYIAQPFGTCSIHKVATL